MKAGGLLARRIQVIRHRKCRLSKPIIMPMIPDTFVNHPRINKVLYMTLEEFDFEEQVAIYIFNYTKWSICAIEEYTKLSKEHIISALGLFTQRLMAKMKVFKSAVEHDGENLISVSEIFPQEARVYKKPEKHKRPNNSIKPLRIKTYENILQRSGGVSP